MGAQSFWDIVMGVTRRRGGGNWGVKVLTNNTLRPRLRAILYFRLSFPLLLFTPPPSTYPQPPPAPPTPETGRCSQFLLLKVL